MGVKRFIRTKIIEPIFGKDKGDKVYDFAMTEVQKAVAVLKTTELGKDVQTIVADVSNKALTGPQKLEAAVVDAVPIVTKYLTGRGAVLVAVDDVKDVTKELVQSVYNDVKSTTAGSLAVHILELFGVKTS